MPQWTLLIDGHADQPQRAAGGSLQIDMAPGIIAHELGDQHGRKGVDVLDGRHRPCARAPLQEGGLRHEG